MPRSLGIYTQMIEARAPFPPHLNAPDGPTELNVMPSGFPAPGQSTHSPVATSTGPGPSTPPQPAGGPEHAAESDPRVPSGPTSL
nr:hypothetical protein [Dictyobacter vulcani]